MVYENICQLVGGTPLLRLHKLSALYGCRTPVVAKLEGWNPSGSVKDRPAFFLLQKALEEGVLQRGGAVVEASGGNSAVSLAMVCAALNLRAILVLPDNMESFLGPLLRAYGGTVVTTPAKEGMEGAQAKARQIYEAELPNAYLPLPFENDGACQAHRLQTGPEILAELPQVDYFITGVGTGATLTGCGEYLKSRCMDCKVIAVEPNDSPVLSGGMASAHAIRGIGPGFVPPILNVPLIDEIIRVRPRHAQELCQQLCRTEGLLCGISSGAALAAAVDVASRPEAQDKTLVAVLPDGGAPYLLSGLLTLDGA